MPVISADLLGIQDRCESVLAAGPRGCAFPDYLTFLCLSIPICKMGLKASGEKILVENYSVLLGELGLHDPINL